VTGFHVDPELLAASGVGLQGVADRLVSELTAFQAELAGFGAPWGGDDIGSLIGVAHDEVSSFAFECYQVALEEIGAAGADVVAMGARYTAVEESITDGFGEIQSGLGG
jgi:hypothetical protein